MTNLERVYAYPFGDIYANYVAKVERKDKSIADLDDVLTWFTGHTTDSLHKAADSGETLREFFVSAPQLNPNSSLITGVICGVRVEDVEEGLMRNIRRMDKLVDELARGKKLENIKRSPKQ